MPTVQKKKKWPDSWRTDYAFREYATLKRMRLQVEDCLQGQHHIKSKGGEYLPKTHWFETHPCEYNAYVQRATFYGETGYAMRIYEGLVMAGSPEILLPSDGRMDFLRNMATVYKRGLHSLQVRVNRDQIAAGLRIMLVEPTLDDANPFVIKEYAAWCFLRAHFINIDGESVCKCVLMDESTEEFNIATKKVEEVERVRVFGLDANGYYYQCPMTPDAWLKFDVDHPADGGYQPVYPRHKGVRMKRIPMTWCGASSLSAVSMDIPYLLDMSDLDLKLYNLDANYAQHLYQSSQETVFFTHAPGDFNLDNIYYGSGAHNALPGDMDVKVVSVNGIGFSEQREYMNAVREQIAQRRMSLLSSKSHTASASVGLVQAAQTSPLRTVVLTSGAAITEQLRYIAKWMGYDNDEILKIQYTPSNEFAKIDTDLTSFVALCKAVHEGSVPMLESDLYRFAKECGFINSGVSWEDFKKQHKIEMRERTDALAIPPTA